MNQTTPTPPAAACQPRATARSAGARRGTVLILVLSLLVIVGVLAMTFLIMTFNDRRTVTSLVNKQQIDMLLVAVEDQITRILHDDAFGYSAGTVIPPASAGPDGILGTLDDVIDPFLLAANERFNVADEIAGNRDHERYDAPAILELRYSNRTTDDRKDAFRDGAAMPQQIDGLPYHYFLRSPFEEKLNLAEVSNPFNATRPDDYGFVTWEDVASSLDTQRSARTLTQRRILDGGWTTIGRLPNGASVRLATYITDTGGLLNVNSVGRLSPNYVRAMNYFPTRPPTPDTFLFRASAGLGNQPDIRLGWHETNIREMEIHKRNVLSRGGHVEVFYTLPPIEFVSGNSGNTSYYTQNQILQPSRRDWRRGGPSSIIDITSLVAGNTEKTALERAIQGLGFGGTAATPSVNPQIFNALDNLGQWDTNLGRIPANGLVYDWSVEAELRYPVRSWRSGSTVSINQTAAYAGSRFISSLERVVNHTGSAAQRQGYGFWLPEGTRRFLTAVDRKEHRQPYYRRLHNEAYIREQQLFAPFFVNTKLDELEARISMQALTNGGYHKIDLNPGVNFLRPLPLASIPGNARTDGRDLFNFTVRAPATERWNFLIWRDREDKGTGFGASHSQVPNPISLYPLQRLAMARKAIMTATGWDERQSIQWFLNLLHYMRPQPEYPTNLGTVTGAIVSNAANGEFRAPPFSVIVMTDIHNTPGDPTRRTYNEGQRNWNNQRLPRPGLEDPLTDSAPDPAPPAPNLPESINFQAYMSQGAQLYIRRVNFIEEDVPGEPASTRRLKLELTLENPHSTPIMLGSHWDGVRIEPVYGIAFGHRRTGSNPRGVMFTESPSGGSIEPEIAAFTKLRILNPADNNNYISDAGQRSRFPKILNAATNQPYIDWLVPAGGQIKVVIDHETMTWQAGWVAGRSPTQSRFVRMLNFIDPYYRPNDINPNGTASILPNTHTPIVVVDRAPGAANPRVQVASSNQFVNLNDLEIYLIATYTERDADGNHGHPNFSGGVSENLDFPTAVRSNLPYTAWVIDSWLGGNSGARTCLFRSGANGPNAANPQDCLPYAKTGRPLRSTGELSRIFRYGPLLVRRLQLEQPVSGNPLYSQAERPMTEWQEFHFGGAAAADKIRAQAAITIDITRGFNGAAAARHDTRFLEVLYEGLRASRPTSVRNPQNLLPGGELVDVFTINNPGMDGVDSDNNGDVDDFPDRRDGTRSYPDWQAPTEWSGWWPIAGTVNVNTAPIEVLMCLPWPRYPGRPPGDQAFARDICVQIVRERAINGPFRSTADLLSRVRFGNDPDTGDSFPAVGFDYFANNNRLDLDITNPSLTPNPSNAPDDFAVRTNRSGDFGMWYEHIAAESAFKVSGPANIRSDVYLDGLDERDYVWRLVGDLIDVRSDVFVMYNYLQVWDDTNGPASTANNDQLDSGEQILFERKQMSVWDRSEIRPRQIARLIPGSSPPRYEYVPHPDYLSARQVGKIIIGD